jgi:hypothetical protein
MNATAENTNAQSDAPNTANETHKKAGKPDFGNGRFSNAASELYSDVLRMTEDITPAEAEKLARDWSSDIGRAFANAPSAVKHGATSKDGKMTLKDASKIATIETRNMTLARLVEHLNEATKKAKGLEGVRVKFEIAW